MNHNHHHENSFMELYNQYSDDIFRFCFVRLRDREKALDATQDTFYKMWNECAKNPEKFFAIDNMPAFLYRVARNTIIDATRKKSSTPISYLAQSSVSDNERSVLEPVEIAHDGPNPEEQNVVSEVLEQLDLLEPHHREILIMRFVNDVSVQDIADTFQISENAASVRIHRALEHARKKLSYLYE